MRTYRPRGLSGAKRGASRGWSRFCLWLKATKSKMRNAVYCERLKTSTPAHHYKSLFGAYKRTLHTPKGSTISKFEYVSYAKISWADYSKKFAETKEVVGMNPFSQEKARNEMFKKLTNTQLN